jgi:hypothetical protein
MDIVVWVEFFSEHLVQMPDRAESPVFGCVL